MGQITRCPSCGTMFKVVPDQLKISDGWVRCGHCAEVFDAQLNLQAATFPLPPAPETVTAAEAMDPYHEADAAKSLVAVHDGHAPGAGVTDPRQAPAWESKPEPSIDMARLSNVPEPHAQDADENQRESESPVTAAPAVTHLAPSPTTEPSMEVSFMREARRRAFWRRPVVRLGLVTLGMALAAILLLQVAVERRDQLAALRPDLRPALEALCQLASCSIQPWRQIDALVIDGSSFNWLAPNLYRLSLSVKNLAGLDVAKPSIELTLTDVRERALLRRVLTPGELGAAAATINAGGEWAGTATVQLAASVSGVAGYRVLAFYP